MKTIYRIVPSPTAPELILEDGIASMLRGESVVSLSPDKPLKGRVTGVTDWTQFYRVGLDAFAVAEQTWKHCMDMYYVITENDVELLSTVADGIDFRVIHPRQFLPVSRDPSQMCDLTYVNALFRIEGRDPNQVFCFEGMANRHNEFKHCYEQFGFHGLNFERVWEGE